MLTTTKSKLASLFAAICLQKGVHSHLESSMYQPSNINFTEKFSSLQLAFNDFMTTVSQISMKRDESIGQIEVATNELEQKAWQDSIQITAEGTFFDGFSMAVLYPDCVHSVKSASNSDTPAIETRTLDICFLSKEQQSVLKPGLIKYDLTVDTQNPLGVTKVTYEPDGKSLRIMLLEVGDSYHDLQEAFDSVMEEFLDSLAYAEAKLYVTIENYLAQVDSTEPNEIRVVESVRTAANKLVAMSLDSVQEYEDVFAPEFPAQLMTMVMEGKAVSFKQIELQQSPTNATPLSLIAIGLLACLAIYFVMKRKQRHGLGQMREQFDQICA